MAEWKKKKQLKGKHGETFFLARQSATKRNKYSQKQMIV